MSVKKCKGECGLIKDISEFNEGRSECKGCKSEYNKKYREENKEKIRKRKKSYYEDNKKEISKKDKEYKEKNREEISKRRKESYQNNRAKILKNVKEYQEENKEKISKRRKDHYQENKEYYLIKNKKRYQQNKEYHKIRNNEYYLTNKETILEQHNEYKKERKKTDIFFKIREAVSGGIYKGLKNNNSPKNGKSCWKYIPYTPEILTNHLESQFEWWMTRENQGVYRASEWDDNDSTTWKWQLDHIVPHSTFYYETMDCEEFQKCWDLSNLRPYSAKQNMIDGATKIRHKNKGKK